LINFHDFIQNEGNTIKKNKGEHVFIQGDSDKSLYLVKSGLLKAYYTSEEGKEFVKSFLVPSSIIGSLISVHSGGECSFSLLCLEPTVLKTISFKKIKELCKENIVLANDMINILIGFGIKKEKREYELLCLSPEKRFQMLVAKSPELISRITQNDLARYLGVTPVGLSRIKKRTLA